MTDATHVREWALALSSATLAPPERRPGLLFDADAAPEIRARGRLRPGMLERIRRRADELLQTPAHVIPPPLATWPADECRVMAEALFLLEEPAYAQWTLRRIEALLAEDTWMFREHHLKHCDHVMANVAALMAWAHDLLGPACPESASDRIAEGLRRHLLLPFLAATRTRAEWWAKAETESNWKIMTCGDAGLAVCAFAGRWPEAREALELAARGVSETLDRVPAEGDWPEGVKYWFDTLLFGLRFAYAIERLTGGAVNLFAHPALRVTGDFAALLATPGGRIFNFNDNRETCPLESLLLLARRMGRPDWLAVARRFPADTVLELAFDDPAVPGEAETSRLTAVFPRTGVATMRTDGLGTGTFVGFKCGPSNVGHSHLDANSFILEAGGAPLLIDEGFWWYGPGFFDNRSGRWEYDNNATIGHNTLLVDGRGQTHSSGPECAGRLVSMESGDGWHLVVGDAGLCYPGLLRAFTRSVLFLPPDRLVIRDVVTCEGERHVEWLMHYAGAVRGDGISSVVENQGVSLTVTPFLPDRASGWRVTDAVRTSTYTSYDLDKEMTPSIRYRAFGPLRAAAGFEFLFGLRIGPLAAGPDWNFQGTAGDWTVRLSGSAMEIRPTATSLVVKPTRSEVMKGK